ncbi:unnamed protein product [Pleuronectes platessa]|uniref:Uncharacterized protein n=1 Tax=Pleuronectes platessa TaxID=8262 RepID=A0A9N7YLQ5_PLEPL|nr:unnamed protein product [Pleuronectes platessa]
MCLMIWSFMKIRSCVSLLASDSSFFEGHRRRTTLSFKRTNHMVSCSLSHNAPLFYLPTPAPTFLYVCTASSEKDHERFLFKNFETDRDSGSDVLSDGGESNSGTNRCTAHSKQDVLSLERLSHWICSEGISGFLSLPPSPSSHLDAVLWDLCS